MQLGMVGLGRMGANLVRRLLRDGHTCVAFDRDSEKVSALAGDGATGADSLEDLIAKLEPPRAVWVMLPAGEITNGVVAELGDALDPDDSVIDGGNSFYKDGIAQAAALKRKRIHFVDVGTSGGVWGLERGYCLMVGAEKEVFDRLEPIFRSIAPGPGDAARTPARDGDLAPAEHGYLHCGPSGAGHYVKMVHNGIEYGLMQAYAEGFDLLAGAGAADVPEGERFDLALPEIAEVWRRGSVVGSWLLDLTANALAKDAALDAFTGHVSHSGEGRWTVQAAVERAVPLPVLSAALYARFRSRQENTFGEKLLSAMRNEFGGHVEQGGKE